MLHFHLPYLGNVLRFLNMIGIPFVQRWSRRSRLEKRARGRPARNRLEVERKILQASTQLLFDQGFAKFSIDAVSRSAGVAKKTVYAMAANREELVGKIVASWTEQLQTSGDHRPGEPRPDPGSLRELLSRIFRIALSKEAVALFRLICADTEGRERLAEIYNRNGVERGVLAVANWLREYQADVQSFDGIRSARMILAALVAEPLRRAAIGLETPWNDSDEEVTARVGECVEFYARILFKELGTAP
ncbi:TetR/AcrR family transcriptional regulator [Mesorhizobium sp. M00.F.Ca.ET.151.01.1.1]|nr:TetR/AcrR family transcriptional regulator [Mesorhizobium sp. M8A.F.Ca.ET.182.01.1.1]TGS78990.1 TetR/AcrR family transcriptional regulator [Mesorhizobium sp. M8A.F.Ca.ET.181.01.1.1]TGU94842.1 TetR/AcrR family transcriptional regulator [Mesorhizobium sp. M00.F.Ca.ET.151.01.1.1]TIT31232.1 MAG: TetR/AcrR family transcriptional regulator [Mesorhizobium sp.]